MTSSTVMLLFLGLKLSPRGDGDLDDFLNGDEPRPVLLCTLMLLTCSFILASVWRRLSHCFTGFWCYFWFKS